MIDWPERIVLRDSGVDADEGQRILTTATGRGYERRAYVRADIVELASMQGQRTLSWAAILDNAERILQMVDQWKIHTTAEALAHVPAYQNRAEALVELVEVAYCGSAGGHDRGQTHLQRRDLAARIRYLRERL